MGVSRLLQYLFRRTGRGGDMIRPALHPRHPEFVGLAQGARNSARQAAIFAARRALDGTPVPRAPVAEVLRALEESDIGSAVRLRGALEALVEELDNEYFDLSDSSGASNSSEARTAFARARAVNALACALEVDPVEAALDAIYEAQASLPEAEVDNFLDSAKALLRTLQVNH
jgi:hypothetical protein